MSASGSSSMSLDSFDPRMYFLNMRLAIPPAVPHDAMDEKEQQARSQTAANRALNPVSSLLPQGPFVPDMSLLGSPLASMPTALSARSVVSRDPKDGKDEQSKSQASADKDLSPIARYMPIERFIPDFSLLSGSPAFTPPSLSVSAAVPRDPKDEKEPSAFSQATEVASASMSSSPKPKSLTFSLKGKAHPEKPSYLPQLLSGNVHQLFGVEALSELTFGKEGSGLEQFGECNCVGMDRVTHPERKRCFDQIVKKRCSYIAKREGNICITHFASGYLLGVFVQVAQLIDDLQKSEWTGTIVISLIDLMYKEAIENDLRDQDDVFIMKTFQSFKKEIARMLPKGMEIEIIFYSNQEDYDQGGVEFDCLIAADLAKEARLDWERIHVAACQEDSYAIELRKDCQNGKDLYVEIYVKHNEKPISVRFPIRAEEIEEMTRKLNLSFGFF